MASDWPAFAFFQPLKRGDFLAFDASPDGSLWDLSCETQICTYIHRDAARAWQAFRDFLNGVDDGEMVDWRHALRECRVNAYREGAEHANLAWTTGVRKR